MLALTDAPTNGGRMIVEVGAMWMRWQIYTKAVNTEDGGVATRWFWRKLAGEARDERSDGFTTQAGFWRKHVPEGRDESSDGFTSDVWISRAPVLEAGEESPGFRTRAECEADAAQHGYTSKSF